jgi:uncharacterized repeat protein (TIGR01451 family)
VRDSAGLAVLALTLLAAAPDLEACLATAANESSGTVCTFQTAVNYGAGMGPHSVAIGDFNGDGKPDLAAANSGSDSVSILLGSGNGAFQPAVNYSVGATPASVAVGDFNRDGKPDLAVVNSDSDSVSILLGNGNGTFQPAVNYGVGSLPESVVVADFNGDGKPDLAVAAEIEDVSILLGNGDGTFQMAIHSDTGTATQPISVAVGDFNGDGKADLAVASAYFDRVSILLGNGNGTFQAAVLYVVRSFLQSIAVGDFNGDGRPDLAVAGYASEDVSILLGNGNGTFQAAVSYGAGPFPRSVAVGDFNGDGTLDLAAANDSSAVWILLGNGNGTFQTAVSYAAGQYSLFVAVGDFNGDGRPDLATANNGSDNVSILLNICKFVTTTTVGSSANPSMLGQPVTFTSTVTSGSRIPTGTVTFMDATTALGTGTLAGGSATLTTSTLTGGSHPITATYGGDGNFAGSSSPALIQIVNPADLSITNTDGRATAAPGSPITYTIVASNAGPNPATGASVTDTVPVSLTLPTWSCVGAGGGTCAASGTGSINDIVDLPVGATVTYTLSGTLSANPSTLVNTATVAPPAGTVDPNPSNNSATDIDSLICNAETIVVPDGRLTASTIAGGATVWLASSLRIGNSYSLELKNETDSSVPPGALMAFRGDDGCSGTSSVTPTTTVGTDPGNAPGSVRGSFTATGTTPLYQFRLVNSGPDIAYTFSVSDTTMYSPSWSTSGSFDTYYSFQNTTGIARSGVLTLFDTVGATLGTFPLSIPAGQTASTNTSSLKVARGKTGTARFTHNGPPGAVLIESAIANFTISPAYVQPVKFQATREAR